MPDGPHTHLMKHLAIIPQFQDAVYFSVFWGLAKIDPQRYSWVSRRVALRFLVSRSNGVTQLPSWQGAAVMCP